MEDYDKFRDRIREVAEAFRKIPADETIRLVSHLDADGICAASIMINALNLEGRKYSLSIVQQLNEATVQEFSREEYKVYVFTDLGSGNLQTLEKYLKGREVFVLDHHEFENGESEFIHHLNPHLFGINGSEEIAGAGVVFLFAKELNSENEKLAHIAIIGAIGDIQEKNNGFMKLNKEILDLAVKHNKIEVEKGLRLFGQQTRPIHKLLEYTTDPYIPGVSGSESGAIQFLKQAGIEPKTGNNWRKIIHLTDDEKQKLASAIIMKRKGEKDPEDIFGNVYTLKEEAEESPLKDAREFSTLLNSCGRMKKASVGIGTCLGNPKIKKKALRVLADYRKQIVSAINWFNDNKDKMVKGDGYIIMNAKEDVLSTVIGTLASIISNSKDLSDSKYIVAMARNPDIDKTKISFRVSRRSNDKVDLRLLVQEIADKVEGVESGGHMNAAGAVIPTEKEEEFIAVAKEVLEKKCLEESVV